MCPGVLVLGCGLREQEDEGIPCVVQAGEGFVADDFQRHAAAALQGEEKVGGEGLALAAGEGEA